MKNIKVAFMVWNPFQVVQFYNLAQEFEDATFLVISKKYNASFFEDNFIKSTPFKYRLISQKEVKKIDGIFDILFFQSAFPNIEYIEKSKLVALQYGLAKENHNYGTWRSLADLNLVYGEYSQKKISPLSPCIITGNPKFTNWNQYKKEECISQLNLDSSKKTILFMPTWGELGNFKHIVPKLYYLSERYNILIKYHHNELKKKHNIFEQLASQGIQIFGGSYDQLQLLCAADAVVSDFSGAIFDAIYAERPTILYQEHVIDKIGIQKFDLESLEFRRRDELGLVCDSVENLNSIIEQALSNRDKIINQVSLIRKKLFCLDDKNSSIRSKQACFDLIDGQLPRRSPTQLRIRSDVRELRKIRIKLKKKAPETFLSDQNYILLGVTLLLLKTKFRKKFLKNPNKFIATSKIPFIRIFSKYFPTAQAK